MTYLLDVNVLIALIDPAHVQHAIARQWFEREGHASWATCPITENGALRIVGDSRYPMSPGSPSAVAPTLAAWRRLPGHAFWEDGISLLDFSDVLFDRLLNSRQTTDTYLLALARSRGGQLATLDKRLVADAVRDGAGSLHLIYGS